MSVYNGATTLAATMDSVLSQEGVDFEFIVINDGSTDGSGAILDDYAQRDSRVRVIHQDNTGLTQALIRGCTEARGKYIARQDVGDYSLPSRLELQKQILDKFPDCVFVSCWTEVLGPENELLYVTKGTGKADYPIFILSKDSKWGTVDGPSSHPSVMFRHDAYMKVGGYRAAFYYGQDWDLWYRLGSVGKFMMIQNVLYQARILINSISGLNKEIQEQLGILSCKAMLLRRQGYSDENIINEAGQIKPVKGADNLRKKKASAYYFIGECLRNNNNKASIKYFKLAIINRPLFLKGWIRMGQQLMSFITD